MKNVFILFWANRFGNHFVLAQVTKANSILDLVQSDLRSPLSEPSWRGARYLFTFVGDFQGRVLFL